MTSYIIFRIEEEGDLISTSMNLQLEVDIALSSKWVINYSNQLACKNRSHKPIDNTDIVGADGNLKKGLIFNQDYLLINSQVWYVLFQLYGGGPLIKVTPSAIQKSNKIDF